MAHNIPLVTDGLGSPNKRNRRFCRVDKLWVEAGVGVSAGLFASEVGASAPG